MGSTLYPLTFEPILKERVWGGRKLDALYQKPLPQATPIGESWEISDRPGDISWIANGSLAGKDLHWLIERHGKELFGANHAAPARFPLLIKLLDAAEKLSLQVHPPAALAATLQGEPKTEMWYIADAAPGAELYVGLRRGVTRAEFEKKIKDGTVADCFHRVQVRAGDAMFLPSGRVHAIGGGLVIFEIQQNSDTTYRVFDWNRLGLDGKPRPLHVAESLASIDFNDFEPNAIRPEFQGPGPIQRQMLVRDPLFTVESIRLEPGAQVALSPGRMQIVGVVSGELNIVSQADPVALLPGRFALLPAALRDTAVKARGSATFLRVE